MSLPRLSVLVAALVLPTMASAPPAAAQPADYSFEPVNPNPRREVGAVLRVRIRDAAGRAQHGAAVLDARIDKSPDGQPGVYAPVTVYPTSDYGVYAFKTDLNTDGRYALSVTVKPVDSPRPVTGSALFTVGGVKPADVPTPAAPVRRR